ncbi:DUF4864 domain-containing protein [Jannaschia donghaensis]|uniref:DUF4864 domain-containing protein n=1 Tax=Jannaschia donghaensis TaxID=420998 RepID=A0A0M6YHH7_9RHOB|nr:DUF4864 domain-containing protein [Jannaschia donghaensis]CTQ48963.1 hypothetical protein JDO7802_00971 [Jannaschia donghaensis]
MKGLLVSISVALAAGPALADESAIQGVIGSQIEAFKVDDFGTAFTYAAPNIQGMFGSADNFGLMVRRGYPMVWQPGTVEYLGVDDAGALWRQDVLITDGFGRLHKLRYTMVETADGWKIAGVQILEAPEVGV